MLRDPRGLVRLRRAGQSYAAALTFNALCELEAISGRGAMEVIDSATGINGRATEARMVVWASLRPRHPSITLTEAGDLIDAHPDVLARLVAGAGDEEAASGKPPGPVRRALRSIWARCFGPMSPPGSTPTASGI